MSSTVTKPEQPPTVRQNFRLIMVKHYCQKLGLSVDTVAFGRFRKTYDQLTDEQTQELVQSLGKTHQKKTGGKRK
jgi:hypothetical protein